jgi:tRNA(fMet)-specific endonuclease VapC
MFLLDTDTYSHLVREHRKVVDNATKAVADGAAIGITIVSKIEVLRGRFDALLKAEYRERFLAAQQQLFRAEAALKAITLTALDEESLEHFERLKATKGLKRIGRNDLLIASIALSRSATLATRNLKHFGLVPRLKLVNWVD